MSERASRHIGRSPKERVMDVVRGQPGARETAPQGDGVPVGPLAVHYCAGLSGCTIREYSTNATRLAECVIRYYERFRPDAVWVSADTWVSAEAMGVEVGSADEDQPLSGLGGPVVRTAADIDRIPAPDPECQGRYPLMVEALSRVVSALGKEVFVVGCFDQYPFSLAASLMGVNEVMLRAIEDATFVKAVMGKCAEYTEAYGQALAEAGADMLSGGDSTAGLLGPGLYGDLAWPYEKRVIENLKRTGKPVSLHICGKATRLLGQMARTGADVVELDHWVDLEEACGRVGPEVTIWGNLDPVGVLARGTVEEVEAAARGAVSTVRKAGHAKFVLSSGCTLAMETPAANLEALNRVARACGEPG